MTIKERAVRLGRTEHQVLEDARIFGIEPDAYLDQLETAQDRTPDEWLAQANGLVGLHGEDLITTFLYESGDDGQYQFVGKDGSSRLTPTNLREFRNGQGAILAATGVLIADMKAADWRGVVRVLLKARIKVDLGPEATLAGECRSWLSNYLSDDRVVPVTEPGDRNECARTGTPYREGERVHVFGPALRKHLALSLGERVDMKRLGRALKAIDAENVVAHVTIDGNKTTRYVWRLPPEYGIAKPV